MSYTRRVIQAAFLALIVIGTFLFAANCERYCPFGGVETLYTYVTEGVAVCSVGTSNFFMIGGLLLAVLLVRRSFCSHICPIGTISEWTGKIGRALRLPRLRAEGAEPYLGWGKYVVLGVVLYFTYKLGELVFRGYCPAYALISRHGEDITFWAYVVAGLIVGVSLFVSMPFCRWFCPLAAVMSPLSRFGLLRVRRDDSACIHCTRCDRACPMEIPVLQLDQVTTARCTLCGECVGACPKQTDGALTTSTPGRKGIGVAPVVVSVLLLAMVAVSVGGAHLFPFPSFVKERGEHPEQTASLTLKMTGLSCRGSANNLWGYLLREDAMQLDGYLRLEAWPGPGTATARVVYDPTQCTEDDILRASTEPFIRGWTDLSRPDIDIPPFEIEGYELPPPLLPPPSVDGDGMLPDGPLDLSPSLFGVEGEDADGEVPPMLDLPPL